jgi:sterol desaturase/sphingolipid hydroxylase (fatty acid hydroxylase superfamily)/rhodanese-related sulfurtransferase
MALWELAVPRRRQAIGRGRRWPSNLGIVVLDTVLVRLAFPTAAVGVAMIAEAGGSGLLHTFDAPAWLAVPVAVLLLDLAIYLQHVLFHAVPALWRLHRMHHADLEFDVTTGLRFHPIEILLSMAIKLGVVAAIGAPPVAVLMFEVLLNATAMFNHGNVGLSQRVDRVLRWLVVTPEMHRVHHSIVPRETNSNFGFNLPWWDRLLGTYRAQPAAGHIGMTIGIEQFRDPAELRLARMLWQPFRGDDRSYPLGRRESASPPGPGRRRGGLAGPRWVDIDELAGRVGNVTVVDVRGPDEFDGPLGHIAGAVNLPLGDLPRRLTEITVAGQRPVILVCRTDKRSAAAAGQLREAGIDEVMVLRGGMERWNQAGLPVERRGVPPRAGEARAGDGGRG